MGVYIEKGSIEMLPFVVPAGPQLYKVTLLIINNLCKQGIFLLKHSRNFLPFCPRIEGL